MTLQCISLFSPVILSQRRYMQPRAAPKWWLASKNDIHLPTEGVYVRSLAYTNDTQLRTTHLHHGVATNRNIHLKTTST